MKRKSLKTRKGFSLTFKVSMTITVIITTLMLGMGSMTYVINHRALIAQETSQGMSIGKLAVELTENRMAQDGPEAVLGAIRSMKSDPKILEAYVTSPSGEVIVHEQPESMGNRMQSRALNAAMESRAIGVQRSVTESGGNTSLLFVAPLSASDGQISGYLHYHTDVSGALAFLHQSALQWIRLFVLAVLVALVLVRLVIVRAVHRPVRRLLKATERVAVGDFSEELETTSRDELGQLGEGFNLMNRQLGVLFRSIHQSVSELDYTSRQIVDRSETLAEADSSWPADRQDEWMKEIVSNGKRLVRVSDKLQAFLNQFQLNDQKY